jgi:GTP pyrophosphokinase
VPIDYTLQNAQQVEIISAKQGGPSRDWLNPALGYLKSRRAQSKARQWFAGQEHEALLAQGRALVEKELQRHGMTALGLDKLAGEFNFAKLDLFLAAVARGDINSRQLGAFLSGEPGTPTPPDLPPSSKPVSAAPSSGGVLVAGVDRLLTVLAKCCKPAPSDPIVGFVTRGHGITIHRKECASLSRLTEESAERLIRADWAAPDVSKGPGYEIDIEVEAQDRQGLLRDISSILLREKIDVTATRAQSRGIVAIMRFSLKVTGLAQMRRILLLIQSVPGVISASRR